MHALDVIEYDVARTRPHRSKVAALSSAFALTSPTGIDQAFHEKPFPASLTAADRCACKRSRRNCASEIPAFSEHFFK